MARSTLEGYIRTLVVDRGFGFVSEVGGPDYFFHMRDLDESLEFGEQLKGRRVRFSHTTSNKGLRAVAIRAAD